MNPADLLSREMAGLTRRKLAKGAAAAALLSALELKPAQAEAPQAVADLAPEGIERLRSIMSRNDVTIVRDVSHLNVDQSYQFLGSDQFLDSARQAGVRTIGNELPAEMQPSIDAFQAAVKTGSPAAINTGRNRFAAMLKGMTYSVTDLDTATRANNNIVDYVGNAARHGIKVVAADPSSNEPKVIDALTDFEKQRDLLNGSVSVTPRTLLALKKMTKDAETIITERASPILNNQIAEALVTQQRLRGGNSLIMFGAGHGDSLTRAFQRQNFTTARVAFHLSTDSMAADNKLLSEYYGQTGKLDNNFMLDTKRFIDDPLRAPATVPVVKAAPKAGH